MIKHTLLAACLALAACKPAAAPVTEAVEVEAPPSVSTSQFAVIYGTGSTPVPICLTTTQIKYLKRELRLAEMMVESAEEDISEITKKRAAGFDEWGLEYKTEQREKYGADADVLVSLLDQGKLCK